MRRALAPVRVGRHLPIVMRILVAASIIVIATVLLVLDVPPFPTWFYVFAWYPSLVIVDTIASARDGRPSVFSSPRTAISLWGWSVFIWLLYEAINFRIANWYYIFLPSSLGWRWLGITVSFATVVPAVVLAERLFHSMWIGTKWKRRPVTVRPRHLDGSVLLGVALLALPMAWPDLFYPLVWGAGVLIADPIVYRHAKPESLIADIEEGRWDRIARIMLGGLAIGFWWEMLNFWARGKWVYTVPFLEEVKLFEMPPFGFVGFPVFALSAWSLYKALHLVAGAGPRRGVAIPKFASRVVVAAAVTFSIVTLQAMEGRTVSSTVPALIELPGVDESVSAALRAQRVRTPFHLSKLDPATLAADVGLPIRAASALVDTATLVTLRGIGTVHLLTLHRSGIRSVCDLARADRAAIWREAHATPVPTFRPTEAEVRVWIRAAQRRCSG